MGPILFYSDSFQIVALAGWNHYHYQNKIDIVQGSALSSKEIEEASSNTTMAFVVFLLVLQFFFFNPLFNGFVPHFCHRRSCSMVSMNEGKIIMDGLEER